VFFLFPFSCFVGENFGKTLTLNQQFKQKRRILVDVKTDFCCSVVDVKEKFREFFSLSETDKPQFQNMSRNIFEKGKIYVLQKKNFTNFFVQTCWKFMQ